jgi:hypothetical protein
MIIGIKRIGQRKRTGGIKVNREIVEELQELNKRIKQIESLVEKGTKQHAKTKSFFSEGISSFVFGLFVLGPVIALAFMIALMAASGLGIDL